jgi:hypothetical protein
MYQKTDAVSFLINFIDPPPAPVSRSSAPESKPIAAFAEGVTFILLKFNLDIAINYPLFHKV